MKLFYDILALVGLVAIGISIIWLVILIIEAVSTRIKRERKENNEAHVRCIYETFDMEREKYSLYIKGLEREIKYLKESKEVVKETADKKESFRLSFKDIWESKTKVFTFITKGLVTTNLINEKEIDILQLTIDFNKSIIHGMFKVNVNYVEKGRLAVPDLDLMFNLQSYEYYSSLGSINRLLSEAKEVGVLS